MRVLFVDDEPNVLRGLKRALRTTRNRWHLEFAEGAQEALRLVESNPPDVLVTDMRMPEISGQELAKKMQCEYPEVLCIGLTGYSKPSENLDSPVLFHQFWSKPCPQERVTESLERIDSFAGRLSRSDRGWLVKLRRLPSVSNVLSKLLVQLSSPRPDYREINMLSKADVGIQAKLVQLGSTSFCGPPRSEASGCYSNMLQETLTRQLFTRDGLFEVRDTPELEAIGEKYCRASMLSEQLAQSEGAPGWVVDCAATAGQLAGLAELLAVLDDSPFQEAPLEHRLAATEYLLAVWGVPLVLARSVAAAFLPWESIEPQHGPEYFTALGFAALNGGLISTPLTLISKEQRS